MPEMNGYEAAEIIANDKELNSIPVIAVTASALKRDEKVISTLCDGYLRKPVSKENLVHELMRFLPYITAEKKADEDIETLKPVVASPEELATQITNLPDEWRKRSVELAQMSLYSDLEDHLKLILTESPIVANAIKKHLTVFRFDLIIDLLNIILNGTAIFVLGKFQ